MNKKVREAINSIPAESSPGLDGMKLLERYYIFVSG
jgi:hypothetical protein